MTETIVLDAASIAVNRTALDITSYIAAAGPDWGDAEITAYMADQQVGSSPVDYRLPNRNIKIPLILKDVGATSFQTINQQLQQKVATFQREQGWIMRQFADRKNLVTNPSFEDDSVGSPPTFGWAAGQAGWTYTGLPLGVLSVVSSPTWTGAKALQVTGTSAGGASIQLGVLAAGTYYASCWLRSTSGSSQASLGAGNNGTEGTTPNISLNTSGWVQAACTFVADGVNMCFLGVRLNSGAGYYVDGVMVTADPTVTSYFDGDTPDHFWLGTRGNSVSSAIGRLYADVQNATLHLGGSWLAAYRNADVDAVLTLECLPDWYGDEITLDSFEFTGAAAQVLEIGGTQAVISGDHPGRCRVTMVNQDANDQHGLLWAFRSRFFDSVSTARLIYEAETLTPLNGGTAVALSGASGGTAVQINTSAGAGTWMPALATDLGGTAMLTHVGDYRVWARAYSPNDSPQLRLAWGRGALATPIINDAVQLPKGTGGGAFYLMDLGEVHVDPPPVGNNRWQGAVQVAGATAGTTNIDALYFQPLGETAGRLAYVPVPSVSSIATSGGTVNSASPEGRTGIVANDASNGGTRAWTFSTTSLLADLQTLDNLSFDEISVNNQTSEWLKATNYGFAVPSGATILGIEARVYYAFDTGAPYVTTVRLVQGGTVQAGAPTRVISSSYAGISPNGQLLICGGPTDLWGGSWSSTIVNNTGFGAAFDYASTSLQQLEVSYIGIIVYYALGTGFVISQDAVIYGSSYSEILTEGAYHFLSGGVVVGPIGSVIGDLPRIPPSGLEGRAVELMLRPSRGDLDDEADSGFNDFIVETSYRPSYLYRP